MVGTPNQARLAPEDLGAEAPNNNFEFEALQLANNYRRAIIGEFADSLRGDVLEVGAGIGQNTAHLIGLPSVKRVVAVEPDPQFCVRFRENFPGQTLIPGTIDALQASTAWDTIVSINVLEHIADDDRELASYARLLAPRKGRLCLFVPARQEIYAPLDKDFGHHRRYSKAPLRASLERVGFQILQLHYFNLVGYFAWWFNFCILKKRHFNPLAVRIYDQIIFPPFHAFEQKLLRPSIGQSLIAIAACP